MQLCMGWKGHNIGFFFSSFINLWLEDSLFPFSCFYIFLLFSMIFFSDWLFFSTDWTCATNSAIVFLPLVGVIYETCFFCFLLVFMDSLMSLSLGSTYIIMKHIEGGALFAECLVGGQKYFGIAFLVALYSWGRSFILYAYFKDDNSRHRDFSP